MIIHDGHFGTEFHWYVFIFNWFDVSWTTFKLARNEAYPNQYFDFRDNIVSMDIYFDQMSYTVLKQLKAMDESSLLSK